MPHKDGLLLSGGWWKSEHDCSPGDSKALGVMTANPMGEGEWLQTSTKLIVHTDDALDDSASQSLTSVISGVQLGDSPALDFCLAKKWSSKTAPLLPFAHCSFRFCMCSCLTCFPLASTILSCERILHLLLMHHICLWHRLFCHVSHQVSRLSSSSPLVEGRGKHSEVQWCDPGHLQDQWPLVCSWRTKWELDWMAYLVEWPSSWACNHPPHHHMGRLCEEWRCHLVGEDLDTRMKKEMVSELVKFATAWKIQWFRFIHWGMLPKNFLNVVAKVFKKIALLFCGMMVGVLGDWHGNRNLLVSVPMFQKIFWLRAFDSDWWNKHFLLEHLSKFTLPPWHGLQKIRAQHSVAPWCLIAALETVFPKVASDERSKHCQIHTR